MNNLRDFIIGARDGVAIRDEKQIAIKALDDAEIVLVDSV